MRRLHLLVSFLLFLGCLSLVGCDADEGNPEEESETPAESGSGNPGAGDGGESGDIAPEALRVSGPETLEMGETAGGVARARLSDGEERDITGEAEWSTSDGGVVSVDGGELTPRGHGEARVCAAWEGERGCLTVRVPAAVEDLRLAPDRAIIAADEDLAVTAMAVYGDDEERAARGVEWDSSDPDIAAVSDDGTVTGVAAGDATITAELPSAGLEAELALTVEPPPARLEGLAIGDDTVTLEDGGEDSLPGVDAEYTAGSGDTPQPGADEVTWRSADAGVASVSGGTLRAVGPGTTTLTASWEGVSDTLEVEVTPVLEGLSLTPRGPTLEPGEEVCFTATARWRHKEEEASDAVTWSADDGLEGSGPCFTAAEDASGAVSVTADHEGRSAETTAEVDRVVEELALAGEPSTLKPGETTPLTAEVTYNDDSTAEVTPEWSSDDPQVVEVSGDGSLTAVAEGETTIRAEYGGQEASVPVEVEATLQGIAVEPASLSLEEGDSAPVKVVATWDTDDGSEERAVTDAVTWSGGGDIAAAEGDRVTTTGHGTTDLTATYRGESATLSLEVEPATEALRIQPAEAGLAVDGGVQLRAVEVLSDGEHRDVTGKARWELIEGTDSVLLGVGGYVTGLAEGEATVRAEWQGRTGEVAVTVGEALPPPEPIRVSARDGEVYLRWDGVPGADSYHVVRATDPALEKGRVVRDVDDSWHLDGDVENGTTYYYAVQSRDDSGRVGASSAAVTATPRAPLRIAEMDLDPALADCLEDEFAREVTTLVCRGEGVEDLGGTEGGVARFTNLSTLDLADNSIERIGPLEELEGLRRLNLVDNAITDLSPLAGLVRLRTLGLSGNTIDDVTALRRLSALEELRLSENAVTGLEPLHRLVNLRELSLRDNSLDDVSPLSDMERLRELRLQDNRLSTLDGLEELTALEFLDLARNELDDDSVDEAVLSPLAELDALEELYLQNQTGGVTDLSPLAGLVALREFKGHGNTVADLSPLQGLDQLELLWLGNNAFGEGELDTLAELPSLVDLRIAGNDLGSLDGLAGMATDGLTHLEVAGNGLDALPSGLDLQGLIFLNIEDNDLDDLSSLDPASESLQRLKLGGNPVAEGGWPAWSNFVALRELDIHATGLTDTVIANNLVNLSGPVERLDFSDNEAGEGESGDDGVTCTGVGELSSAFPEATLIGGPDDC